MSTPWTPTNNPESEPQTPTEQQNNPAEQVTEQTSAQLTDALSGGWDSNREVTNTNQSHEGNNNSSSAPETSDKSKTQELQKRIETLEKELKEQREANQNKPTDWWETVKFSPKKEKKTWFFTKIGNGFKKLWTGIKNAFGWISDKIWRAPSKVSKGINNFCKNMATRNKKGIGELCLKSFFWPFRKCIETINLPLAWVSSLLRNDSSYIKNARGQWKYRKIVHKAPEHMEEGKWKIIKFQANQPEQTTEETAEETEQETEEKWKTIKFPQEKKQAA